jgi:formylmethanofuran dehydrogenase subunit E
MYNETKKAVRKTIEVCKILFSMAPNKFNELKKLTSSIKGPSEEEIKHWVENDIPYEVSLAEHFRVKYAEVAVQNGFKEEQGIAMLEYASLKKDIQ